MDVLELLNQKLFLGQEFLTWLWWLAEEEDLVELPGNRRVDVMLGDGLVLGPAQGREGARVTVRGREASLAEAREALRQGKLVESMRLLLEIDGEQFELTLRAADLGICSLKLPPTASAEEGPEGLILERVDLAETVVRAVERLFGKFLALRLDGGGQALAETLRAWATNGGE